MTRFIGLTGKNASGKGAAADHLKERGRRYLSLSDLLRDELRARGVETSRENLTRIGKELRASEGPAVLAKRALAKLAAAEGDWVIDSIRSPAEVEALRALPGFRLLGIDAPADLRFARLRARGRAGDSATLDEFLRQEAAEDTADPNGQQLSAALALADVVIDNDGELPTLRERLDAALHPAAGGMSAKGAAGALLALAALAFPLNPGLAAGAGFLLVAFWVVLRLRGALPRGPADRATLLFLVAVLWATACRSDLHFFLSALAGGDRLAAASPEFVAGRRALWAWTDYWHVALLPAGALWAFAEAHWRRRARTAFLAASAVAIAAGLVEFATGWNLRWDGLGPAAYRLLGGETARLLIGRETLSREGGAGRLYGLFDHPLTFGGFLCVALFLCAAFARRDRLSAALAAGAGFLTVVAANRAYWLALPAGLVALARKGGRKAWLRAALACTTAVGLVLLFPAVRSRAVGESASRMMGGRGCFWRAGGAMALEKPLAGWGPQGWRLHGRPYLAAVCPGETNLTHVHDAPLQLLVEGGLPLLAAAGWLLWVLAGGLRRRSGAPGPERALARGALAALAAFCVAGLFEWNFMDKEAALPLFFWIGAALHPPAGDDGAGK